MSMDGGLTEFNVDFTQTNELPRLAAVLTALGENWDPGEALIGEKAAHGLLYSDLDAEQQATYDMLVAAGVLPSGIGG